MKNEIARNFPPDSYIPEAFTRPFIDTENEVLVLQYWMFYLVDREHEGDREMIQLEFAIGKVTDIHEALSYVLSHAINPVRAIYSQDSDFDIQCWTNQTVLRTHGTNPEVYVERGTHANHHRLIYSDGQSRSDDLDHVPGDAAPVGYTLVPFHGHVSDYVVGYFDNMREYLLPVTGSDALPWLEFKGRWGEQTQDSNTSGPLGPAFTVQWQDPGGWWKSAVSTSDGECPSPTAINFEEEAERVGKRFVEIVRSPEVSGAP